MDSLNPSAARAARELRRRQEPMWRTAADEEAGCLEIAATLRGSGATEEQVRDVAKALVNYSGSSHWNIDPVRQLGMEAIHFDPGGH